MKPHVLIANVFFAPNTYGGATIVAQELAYRMAAAGRFRVSAVSLCARPELPAYGMVKTQTKGIDNYLINVPDGRGFRETFDNPAVTQRIERLINALQPDVLHAHCLQDMGVGALVAARQAGLITAVSVHDYWWICERQFLSGTDGNPCGKVPLDVAGCRGCVPNIKASRDRRMRLMEALEQADLITYPSPSAKAICERAGMPRDRGVVLENGINSFARDCFDRRLGKKHSDSPVVFGYLGGPSSIKGWPWIREAFAGIKRDDFKVVLVDGSLEGSWWKLADFAGLPGNWEIAERFDQAEMDRFYDQIDTLLFPSQWPETFGLGVREALARGIPVIGTAEGSLAEIAAMRPMQVCESALELREKIISCLETGITGQKPVAVRTFDDQAQQLSRLFDDLLDGRCGYAPASVSSMAKGESSAGSVPTPKPELIRASSLTGASGV